MRDSTDFRVSTRHPPVQSVLPLFDAVNLSRADLPNADPGSADDGGARRGGVEQNEAHPAAERIKSARSRDPLKQARQVATALRRGEFDVRARQAAVNSLCQYLIDSLQSPANKIPH